MRGFPGPPIIGLIVLSTTVVVPPLYGQQIPFDAKAMVLRLAAIEQKNPYRLRELVGNGRPTLIAFIDHLCYTCLRSVEDVEQLKRDFSVRANIVVIDPSHITTAHSWAKDHYQVWFVPKFIIFKQGGKCGQRIFWPNFPSRLGVRPSDSSSPVTEASRKTNRCL